MRLVRRWLRRVRSALLQLFEPLYAQELIDREPIGTFKATLATGFTIEVRCDRMVFCEAGQVDNTVDRYYVYRLYAMCDGQVPDKLKKACQLEIQYPIGYLNPSDSRYLFDVMASQYLHLLNLRLVRG